MPTTRPRHMITETEDVERAIDAAALVWPELRTNHSALLRLIIKRGAASVEAAGAEHAARVAAVRKTSGALPDVYRPDELEALREEWPSDRP